MTNTPWGEDWKESRLVVLDERWKECTKCDLHQTRAQTVFARGAINADIMAIGDSPGDDDDREGYPFVGETGNLLEQMLEAAGVEESEVLLAHTVSCHPPRVDNKQLPPSVAQMKACWPRLQEMIQLVDPAIIIPVGAVATKFLMKATKMRTWTSIVNSAGKMGSVHVSTRVLPGTLAYPAMPIVHPAFILRTDAIDPKTETWARGGFYWQTIDHLRRAKRIVEGLRERKDLLVSSYRGMNNG